MRSREEKRFLAKPQGRKEERLVFFAALRLCEKIVFSSASVGPAGFEASNECQRS